MSLPEYTNPAVTSPELAELMSNPRLGLRVIDDELENLKRQIRNCITILDRCNGSGLAEDAKLWAEEVEDLFAQIQAVAKTREEIFNLLLVDQPDFFFKQFDQEIN